MTPRPFVSTRNRGFSTLGLLAATCCLAIAGACWLKSSSLERQRTAILERQRTALASAAPHTKAIEDINVGDWVMAKDPDDSGPPTPHRVVGVPKNWTKHIVHVQAACGELQATRLHPFWVKGHGWTDAGNLHFGDQLLDDQGHRVAVIRVWQEDRTCTTYNLTVEGVHTYYVMAGNTPVLVHNVNVYPDPTQPGYSNGSSNLDHIRARSLGGGNQRSNLQSLPSETNFRKGGYEGQLGKDWEYYEKMGLSDEEIEQVLGPEIKSLGNSPPPRPMDPDVLDSLPSKPCP